MTKPFQINRRAFLGGLITAPLLTTACQKDYGRYFDIEWDEEVELHNGEIIIVHIKRTFERVTGSMRRSRWDGVLESTEISFNMGNNIETYKKKFIGYDVRYINKSKESWYILLMGQGRVLNRVGVERIVDQMLPVLIIFPNGEERMAESLEEIPFFPVDNLLRVLPDSEYVSRFNGTMVTLAVKTEHARKFPTGKIKNANGVQPQPE